MVKVIHLSVVNTTELFKTREFMLGDNAGEWFVVDDDLYLGRYIDKFRAEEHAARLDGPTPSEEEFQAALKFAEELSDDNI